MLGAHPQGGREAFDDAFRRRIGGDRQDVVEGRALGRDAGDHRHVGTVHRRDGAGELFAEQDIVRQDVIGQQDRRRLDAGGGAGAVAP